MTTSAAREAMAAGVVVHSELMEIRSEFINGFPRISELEFLESANLNYASVS